MVWPEKGDAQTYIFPPMEQYDYFTAKPNVVDLLEMCLLPISLITSAEWNHH